MTQGRRERIDAIMRKLLTREPLTSAEQNLLAEEEGLWVTEAGPRNGEEAT
ncbi:MAG TPA: hypothetical protein VEK74_11225 [Burkholderiaceae bacterium]|nr:hypothetical protein [Burkholderiaceae bacterium]